MKQPHTMPVSMRAAYSRLAAIIVLLMLLFLASQSWGRYQDQQEQERWRQQVAAAVVAQQSVQPTPRTQTISKVLRGNFVTIHPGYKIDSELKPTLLFSPFGLSEAGHGYLLIYADRGRQMRFHFTLNQPSQWQKDKYCSKSLKKDESLAYSYVIYLHSVPYSKTKCDEKKKSYEIRYFRPLNDKSGLELNCWGIAPYGTPIGQRITDELLAACQSVKITRLPSS